MIVVTARGVHPSTDVVHWPSPIVLGLLVVLTGVLAIGSRAESQGREKPKPRTRQVQAVSDWAFQKLGSAQQQLADEQYAECLATLGKMKERESLSAQEKALMWQTYAYVYSAQGNYEKAAGAFEQCIEMNGLPEGAQLDAQYNLAQLYVFLERFQKAVTLFAAWMAAAENPAPSAHYMYAIALTQNEDTQLATQQARMAVTKSPEPKEPWLELLLSLYLQQKQYRNAVVVLDQLVERFPKKVYWTQLSAVHSELGEHRKALAALEVAYRQGMLTKDQELVTLAQLYLYNEIPYKAAEVLETGLESKTIDGDADAWELLATSWLSARERMRAMGPLERAARLANDGELYARLANVQIDQEQYAAARDSLTNALRKGKLKDPGNAHLLLGIASVSDGQWDQARKAFESATQYEKAREAARQWLGYIDAEMEDREVEEGEHRPAEG